MVLKKIFIYSLAVILGGGVTQCRDSQSGNPSDNPVTALSSTDTPVSSNNARIKVQIHDTPFIHSGKTVSELNITVQQVDIIRSSDNQIITLSNTPSTMNILDITANDPVLLSDTSVEPVMYDQLRLILTDNSTIVVDGITYPITIPSSEQTGVKLNGPFYLPPGALYTFDLDFVPVDSVLYTNGQGYKLKPVINITNTGSVLGIFRGNLLLEFTDGQTEIVMELRENFTTRVMFSDYPNIVLNGFYYYDSVNQQLSLLNLSAIAGGGNNNPLTISNFIEGMPDPLVFPVTQWSLDDVIVLDIQGNENALSKVNDFAFSSAFSTTILTVNVNYPDHSADGKYVVTQFQMLEGGSPPIMRISQITGNQTVETFLISNNYFPGNQTQANCTVKSYLFESIEDIHLVQNVYGGRVSFDLSGSRIKQSTVNVWQPDFTFSLTKLTSATTDLNFQPKLNIQMTPPDFATAQPEVSWNA